MLFRSRSTLDEEDYYMAEKSQQAAASGKVEYFIFGRNEPRSEERRVGKECR